MQSTGFLRDLSQRPIPVAASLPSLLLAMLVACAAPQTTTTAPSTNDAGPTPAAIGPSAPPSTTTQITGIDVSHFDGAIDWPRVAASGARFAFIKATEGIDLVDSAFAANWSAAGAAGILRGAYHFFRPEDDAAQQARFFLATAGETEGDLPPVLDVEITSDQPNAAIIAGIRTWLTAVEAKLGVEPIIYTSLNFWNALGTDAFGSYPLWLAEYQVTEPTLPNGWTHWTFWQDSEDGTVAGIGVPVDHDRFYSNMDTLTALLIP